MEKARVELDLEASANRIVEEVFGPEFAKEYVEFKKQNFEVEGE